MLDPHDNFEIFKTWENTLLVAYYNTVAGDPWNYLHNSVSPLSVLSTENFAGGTLRLGLYWGTNFC